MAMFLKLEASSVANTKIQSTPGIPDFMDWNQITALPFFWVPFKSLPFALFAVIAVPTLVGLHPRRRHVQAPRRRRLLRHHHPGAGGGADDPDRRASRAIPAASTASPICARCSAGTSAPTAPSTFSTSSAACCCSASMLLARFVLASKLGRILVAVRDKEDRVRFSGYDVANFKIFIFCLASAMAAVGGAMFTLQVGFMSPSFVGIVPSIEMVIFCAVGGRQSIVGAVVGTLLVNWGKTVFSESFPGAVAVRHGRLVHRGGARLPARPRRTRDRPNPATAWSVDGVRPQRAAERCADAGRIREDEPCPPAPISCSRLKSVTVSFDGFKAVDGLNLYIDQGRAARHHRAERRRQDHRARPDLRAHQGLRAVRSSSRTRRSPA